MKIFLKMGIFLSLDQKHTHCSSSHCKIILDGEQPTCFVCEHPRNDLCIFPLESIQIDPIDVSTNRRLWESSQSNRLEEDQCLEMECAVGVRLNISSLTLNPMGKRRCLEIEKYAGGYAAKANVVIESIDSFTLQALFGCRHDSLRAFRLVREN